MQEPSKRAGTDGSAQQIVAAIRAGDAIAEGELVAIYRPRLLFAATRLVGDPMLAEDLANEALMIGILHLREGRVEHADKVGGYLFGIARNLSRRYIRNASREVISEEPETQVAAQIELSPTPEDELTSARATATLRAALDTLEPERYREILVRHYVRQEEKATICDAMELSSLHYNRVLWRARKALGKALERRGMRALS